jgi:transposase
MGDEMRHEGDMRPSFAKGNKATISKLGKLREQAIKDKHAQVVLRIQGILMSMEGQTCGEIAHQLKVPRSTVPLWIDHWNRHGPEGLWEGQHNGRPSVLSSGEREKLRDILDRGPEAYGLETGIWSSPLVRQVIDQQFGQQYHAGHVRRLLKRLDYSVQRPSTRLVQTNLQQKRK